MGTKQGTVPYRFRLETEGGDWHGTVCAPPRGAVHYSLQFALQSQSPICCIRTQPTQASGLRLVVPRPATEKSLRDSENRSGHTMTWHLGSSLRCRQLICCSWLVVTHLSQAIADHKYRDWHLALSQESFLFSYLCHHD